MTPFAPPLPGITFHHLGVACQDIDADERAFAVLGYARERPDCVDTIQGVRARFLVGAGPRIELVRNLEVHGVLSAVVKAGIKLYHIAYEVEDLVTTSAQLESIGAKQVVAPVPGIAFDDRLICFYMLPNLVLIELIGP